MELLNAFPSFLKFDSSIRGNFFILFYYFKFEWVGAYSGDERPKAKIIFLRIRKNHSFLTKYHP